ncbi:hypothetical protein HR45_07645 [Shewanella mangrovi]|uniref:Uncharacterized protein n=1 Tax=Shewanella mangrovi TaxID=1515746 RepID=A0A094K151_9GAMM|nr:DUF6776 family protein [Shewanella mangrovi]KFZ38351.1 hypothetical protein HR45_07645 [Shewanella mangrovi]
MANFRRWWHHMQLRERHLRTSSLYLFALVLVAFCCGAVSHYIYSDASPVGGGKYRKLAQQYQQQLETQATVLASRNMDLSLAQETNKQMQEMFAKQHQRQQDLERELSFYRSIMAPEYSIDGVAINSLELLPKAAAGDYKLKLVLTQLKKRKQQLKGKAIIQLKGSKAGEDVEIPLESVNNGAKLDFSFRYFQVLETEMSLPEGFKLQQIAVKVVVPASRWSKGGETEQSFSVPELLNGEKDTSVILEQNTQVIDNQPQQTDVKG